MSQVSRVQCQIAALLVALPLTAAAQTNLVIVSGIGGDPKYTREFGALSSALAQAAHERGRLSEANIVWLGDTATTRTRWYRGMSTRANIEATLQRLADGNGQVVLVLIGHGSGEGAETRISLPGPDMTAADFGRVLAKFGNRRVAFVNLTSASGDMVGILSAPHRVVVTATKSAFQRNESQFARFFVDAFAKDGADTDKDSRVSLLEAFRYAESETKRYYETDGKLATENAQLADEGQLAGRFFLSSAGGSATAGAASPRLTALYGERAALDDQIAALKKRKSTLTTDAYEAELEKLLLSLAMKSREIRQLERGS